MNASTTTPSVPLERLDVSRLEGFRDGSMWQDFARLRREDPVHYCPESLFGPYWSVTCFKDIIEVETHPQIYSSDVSNGGMTIMDTSSLSTVPMFIAMDPPQHTQHRKAISPMVAPENLARLEFLIRERAAAALDQLPIGEEFDWVKRVSINLTTQMLATLLDFPWEERSKLTHWSDVATTMPGAGVIDSEEQRMAELGDCATTFARLWGERVNAEPSNDLISMLAHNPATRNMSPEEYLGNVLLLIVGGNDTTRNSMSAGLLALHEHPAEYAKLCADLALIPSAVSEIIRWHSPVAHMRRTAMQDTTLAGKQISKGDKVILWYVSANRDDQAIEDPDNFLIDRQRPRHHIAFGFGIHRCVGNRLAELQLRVLWEEILRRWPRPGQIEVVGPARRALSNFVRGIESLPVRIRA